MNPSHQQVQNSQLSYKKININIEVKVHKNDHPNIIEHDSCQDVYTFDRDNSFKKISVCHDLLENQNSNFIGQSHSIPYNKPFKDEQMLSDIPNQLFHPYHDAQIDNDIIQLNDIEKEPFGIQSSLINQDIEDELGLLCQKVEQKNMPLVLIAQNKSSYKQKLTQNKKIQMDQISHFIYPYEQQDKDKAEQDERKQLQLKNFKMIRKEKIQRYLQKKKNRRYEQTIMYGCRKSVADRRLRYKGRFINEEQAIQILNLQGNKQYQLSFLKQQLKCLQKN